MRLMSVSEKDHDAESSKPQRAGNASAHGSAIFRTISIITTVYVSLENVNTVVEKMQVRRVNGNTDLLVAATTGDLNAVGSLLAKVALVIVRNMFGSTALMGASAGGYNEIVKLLLVRGAQVNRRTARGTRR